MDACDASNNAVKKLFPDKIILMCYFHMKFNCKKNYEDYGLTIKEWTIVDKDNDYLHSSMRVKDLEIL